MLGTILRLFRPSYALTALILFGAWQGYSFVKSIPEELPLSGGSAEAQPGAEGQSEAVGVEQAQSDQAPAGPIVTAIQGVHPMMRILYWLAVYVLLCFAGVPLIKKMLAKESNLVNTFVIILYSALGLLLAFGLAAFQFGWAIAILTGAAVAFSAAMIIRLAGELEKLRVQESLR